MYNASFKLGSKPEQLAECMIEEYEPNKLLTTKYSGNAFRLHGYVRESYRLVSKRGGTRVQQIIDFTHSEISFIIQLIMKFISIVGYSVGKGPLDGIKDLAEGEESQHIAAKGRATVRPERDKEHDKPHRL
jgi:hypothetical protein